MSMGETITAALREADEAFVSGCAARLAEGEEKYGSLKFLGADTLEEAMLEILDLANYARLTYIKLYLLQMSVTSIVQKESMADKEGFVSLKEMFGS